MKREYTLKELEAHFIRYEKGIAGKGHGRPNGDGTFQWGGFEIDVIKTVKELEKAHGVTLLCPLCFERNGGNKGTHWVDVSFSGRGLNESQGVHNAQGKAVRWEVNGTGLNDLVISPSILIQGKGSCGWHGFIGSSGVSPGHAK